MLTQTRIEIKGEAIQSLGEAIKEWYHNYCHVDPPVGSLVGTYLEEDEGELTLNFSNEEK